MREGRGMKFLFCYVVSGYYLMFTKSSLVGKIEKSFTKDPIIENDEKDFDTSVISQHRQFSMLFVCSHSGE